MEKHELDDKITEVSKSILSYCISRTSNQHDAQDLAQDIIVELIKSSPNIRDNKAFYGFMWAVAGNVYKHWYSKKLKINECELTEDVHDNNNIFVEIMDDNKDLYLLRRELTLMSQKYRKATILYYLENKSCAEISIILEISESMVKYLLFKARKILKEGMNMNRTYGEQSYNPKQLCLMYMGEGPNKFWQLLNNKIIPQNILWACYNDDLNEEEISLQIGVALPYLENEIKILVDAGVLLKNGNKYNTNIIIMSKDFNNEVSQKTAEFQYNIAETVNSFLIEHEDEIRNIGFFRNNMSHNTYMWQMMCITLLLAFEKFDGVDIENQAPITAFGERAYVWGEEEPHSSFSICQMNGNDAGIDEGCMLQFMDWNANPKGDHHDFYNDKKLTNLYVKLAKGEISNPNEYEKEMIATLIKKGYVINKDGTFTVTVPVFTRLQFDEIISVLNPLSEDVYKQSKQIFLIVCEILKNHTPSHLRKVIKGIAHMRLFNDAVSAPARIMHRKDFIKTDWDANEMPTTYIILT